MLQRETRFNQPAVITLLSLVSLCARWHMDKDTNSRALCRQNEEKKGLNLLWPAVGRRPLLTPADPDQCLGKSFLRHDCAMQ